MIGYYSMFSESGVMFYRDITCVGVSGTLKSVSKTPYSF